MRSSGRDDWRRRRRDGPGIAPRFPSLDEKVGEVADNDT